MHMTMQARRQQGIVLLMALVMLVALTLAGIALVRSVYTANIIAGNLAFQQAAVHAADAGIEDAIDWLRSNYTGVTLHNNASSPKAYVAYRQDPSSSQTWEDFWKQVLEPAGQVNTLATDAATGNTVAYVIHRLCNAAGDPASGAGCSYAPATDVAEGNSKGAGEQTVRGIGTVYYRITARVSGPRNTISYVQAIVSM